MENISPGLIAVGLSLLLYIFYVLLPLVPALIIFKVFPDTKVALQGPFQNFTLNATGAFAAYVVTVGLGVFLVNNTTNLISSMTIPTWKVRAQIELRDADNKLIVPTSETLRLLAVQIKPDRDDITAPFVTLKIPLPQQDDWPKILVAVPGFSSLPVDLGQVIANKEADRDNFQRIIKLKKPIVLTLNKPVNNTKTYNPLGAALEPLSTTISASENSK